MTTAASMVCELFKLLRNGPLNRTAIECELHWSGVTVEKWCREMTANGMLVETLSAPGVRPGPRSMLYALSREWGGKAP